MNSDTLKPNVQELQRDAIDLLRQISSMMERARTQLWFNDGSENKYEKYQQQVDRERRKVENLELRMAIAAPMNAGKSTIINAIIGQELLPSCATAMTTLPTEIVFKASVTEPLLKLSSQIRSVFQEAVLTLKQKIDEQGIDRVLKETAEYPHLADLLRTIQNKAVPIPAEISGCEAVNRLLTDLNHIIRLCSILELPQDPLQLLIDIPRVETPFWRWQSLAQGNSLAIGQPEQLGNLVIVDTPGPNEAKVSSRLEAVVLKQLRDSQLVLIVLDFTALRAEAAEKIKEEVQKVIRSRGKKNLYVLVNKVDQRGEGDITPDQVQQFVANNLKLIDASDMNRVFEVSAKQAFCATNFLNELQQHPDIPVSELKTAQAFAKAVFGLVWKESLARSTKEQLQKSYAQMVWEQSGFAEFLDKAINSLIAEVAPRCIESTINLCMSYLVGLSDDVKLRRGGIESKAEEIKVAVEALNDELFNLQACRNGLQGEIFRIKNQLRQEVNATLDKLKGNAREQISKIGRDYAFELFTKLVTQFFKKFTSVLSREAGIFEFESQEDAKIFANKVAIYTKLLMETLIDSTCKDTEVQTEKLILELSYLLESQTRPIMESARSRLHKGFYVTLDLDPLQLVDVDINLTEPGTIVNNSFDFNINNFYDNLFENFFNLIVELVVRQNPIVKAIVAGTNFLFGVKQKAKAQYTISLTPYVQEVTELIENKVEELKSESDRYIENYFDQKVERYFKALDSYLGNYRSDLEQAIRDRSLSVSEQNKLKQALNSFVVGNDKLNVDKLVEKANSLRKRTNQLLHK